MRFELLLLLTLITHLLPCTANQERSATKTQQKVNVKCWSRDPAHTRVICPKDLEVDWIPDYEPRNITVGVATELRVLIKVTKATFEDLGNRSLLSQLHGRTDKHVEVTGADMWARCTRASGACEPGSQESGECCYHHVNVHSCSSDLTNGHCEPWIGNDGVVSTHSPALTGYASLDGRETFKFELVLFKPGSYKIIAHAKLEYVEFTLESGDSVHVVLEADAQVASNQATHILMSVATFVCGGFLVACGIYFKSWLVRKPLVRSITVTNTDEEVEKEIEDLEKLELDEVQIQIPHQTTRKVLLGTRTLQTTQDPTKKVQIPHVMGRPDYSRSKTGGGENTGRASVTCTSTSSITSDVVAHHSMSDSIGPPWSGNMSPPIVSGGSPSLRMNLGSRSPIVHRSPMARTVTFGSVQSTLESLRRPNAEVEECSDSTFTAAVAAEVARWPESIRTKAAKTVEDMLSLVRGAQDGALVIVAPKVELQRLDLQSTDTGYMSRRLKDMAITSPEFQEAFLDFTTHEENDRWPSDHPNADARGLPKDGAILISPKGEFVIGAVKVVGLPLAICQWAGFGTRHETALGIASFLRAAVVLIRSSAGTVHCLLARDRGCLILQLE